MVRYAALFVALISSFAPAVAQTNYVPVGIPQNSSTIVIPLGFVDPLSGQIHLEIPLASVAVRGFPPYVATLVYDSTYYQFSGLCGCFVATNLGWRLVTGAANVGVVINSSSSGTCPSTQYPYGAAEYYSNFAFEDMHGTLHPAAYSATLGYFGNCLDTAGQSDPNNYGYASSFAGSPTLDGSGYTISTSIVSGIVQSQAWAADGTTAYAYANAEVNTNGNTVSQSGAVGQFTQAPITSRFYNCTSANPGYVYVYASDGSKQTYTITCKSYTVSIQGTHQGTEYMPATLTLPDSTQYSFTYDTGNTSTHLGSLTGYTLPTGGAVSVGYSAEGNYSYYPTSMAFAGGAWNLSTVYSGSGLNTQEVSTVLAPPRYDAVSKKNVTDKSVYTSATAGPPWHIQQIQYYSGSTTPVKTVSYGYTGPYGTGCLSSLTTTNDANQTASVQYQFNSGQGTSACMLPTQKQEFDFGASTPTRDLPPFSAHRIIRRFGFGG